MRSQALAFTGRGRIELVEFDLPALGSEDVLVETELTAVSQGTDRAMLTGSYAGVENRYPFIYGYSRVGRVIEVGSSVSGAAVGERVFVGMAGTRLNPASGFGEQGGSYTAQGVVHQSELVRLPEHVDSQTAAVAALAAIAYQGVVSSAVRPNSRVLVVGLGAIGQFSALIARFQGAQVWAADPIASRRELAARISGAVAIDPANADLAAVVAETASGTRPWRGRNGTPASLYEQGRWAQASGVLDVVIDATGRADAFEAYLPLITREGSLCLQGYYAKPLTLDFHAAHLKRLAIRCPGGMDIVDYEAVLKLLTLVDLSGFVGLEIPIATAAGALQELLLEPTPEIVSAVIRWRPAEGGA